MSITIGRAVQTCPACPSQWDAWTTDGEYVYLRYRFGRGTIQAGPPGGRLLAEFGEPSMDGSIDLSEFADRAGLVLADDVQVVSYEEYMRTSAE